MAQAGYTPISLYYSTTASAQPQASDLVAGELALNTNDEKLYFKNSAGTVKLLASSASTTNVQSLSFGTTGLTPSTATTGAITVAGTLAVANGGTGITSFGTGVATALGSNVTGSGGIVLATSPTLTTPLLGTPTSGTLTNCTGLPLSTGVTGTLGISSGGTNITTYTTGDILYASASNTLAKLPIGSSGQLLSVSGGVPAWSAPPSTGLTVGTTSIASGTNGYILYNNAGVLGNLATTGSGSVVQATSPTLVTPVLGTPTSGTLTNCTGLPLSTGITGTLATTNGGTGSTSTTYCNLTTNVTGTLPVANGGTGATTLTAYAVVCGGTTSTGAVQSIASVGTAGQVLTSNGAGALPTFQAAGGSSFPAGTRMSFQQTSAPTGWTKDTTAGLDNSAMRIVTGSVVNGGSVNFTTAFASQTPSGSVTISSVSGSAGATTLTTPQIPSHTHPAFAAAPDQGNPNSGFQNESFNPGLIVTNATGGGGSHTHPFSFSSGSGTFSGNAINLAVKYYDFIIASKD